jgi:hypothetical protein
VTWTGAVPGRYRRRPTSCLIRLSVVCGTVLRLQLPPGGSRGGESTHGYRNRPDGTGHPTLKAPAPPPGRTARLQTVPGLSAPDASRQSAARDADTQTRQGEGPAVSPPTDAGPSSLPVRESAGSSGRAADVRDQGGGCKAGRCRRRSTRGREAGPPGAARPCPQWWAARRRVPGRRSAAPCSRRSSNRCAPSIPARCPPPSSRSRPPFSGAPRAYGSTSRSSEAVEKTLACATGVVHGAAPRFTLTKRHSRPSLGGVCKFRQGLGSAAP